MSNLNTLDYIVCVLILLLSIGIGVYFGYFDKKRKLEITHDAKTDEFLLGSRKMKAIPVACSLMASFFSAITLLGTPNEIYQYGIMYSFIGISYAFTMVISAYLFVPVFYDLEITSSYQYLGFRFSKINQVLATIGFILQMVPYIGIVMYGPSLAMSALVDVNMWVVVVIMCVTCTIYTTMGGFKAVVWTEVLQLAVMFAGTLAIIIKGSAENKGYGEIMKVAAERDRLKLSFSADFRVRHTFWSVLIGGTFLWCGIYSINPTMIQRAVSVRTLKESQLAYLLNFPGATALLLLLVFGGYAVFHKYRDCDPLLSKLISKSDQLLPYYVLHNLVQYPGVGGIFVAGIFCGSISTVASGLNALAAVTLKDLILLKYTSLDDKTSALISKILVVIYGIISLMFSFLCSFTSKILEAALSLFGMLSGPTLGVFTLGMFFPFTNFRAAVVAHILGQIFIFWIGFGALTQGIKHPSLSLVNQNCTGKGFFNKPTTYVIASSSGGLSGIQHLYAISYIWYTFISWLFVLIIGITGSIVTNRYFYETQKVPQQYISPLFQKLWSSYLHMSSQTAPDTKEEIKSKN